jgi:hypothetical protein
MGKILFSGQFNWYGADAIQYAPIMYTRAYTMGGATASFMSRIATHLGVSISKVINYYKDHPNGFKVKEV